MQALLMIGAAGALGTMARYGIGLWAGRTLGEHFAFGTLAVNVLGCLLLGILLELERTTSLVTPSLKLLAAVGFLGALTTFSTFGYETFRYWQGGTGASGGAEHLGEPGVGPGGGLVGLGVLAVVPRGGLIPVAAGRGQKATPDWTFPRSIRGLSGFGHFLNHQ